MEQYETKYYLAIVQTLLGKKYFHPLLGQNQDAENTGEEFMDKKRTNELILERMNILIKEKNKKPF